MQPCSAIGDKAHGDKTPWGAAPCVAPPSPGAEAKTPGNHAQLSVTKLTVTKRDGERRDSINLSLKKSDERAKIAISVERASQESETTFHAMHTGSQTLGEIQN